jgi:hypothetical protein
MPATGFSDEIQADGGRSEGRICTAYNRPALAIVIHDMVFKRTASVGAPNAGRFRFRCGDSISLVEFENCDPEIGQGLAVFDSQSSFVRARRVPIGFSRYSSGH